MDDAQKMLRAIINSQGAFRQEFTKRIAKLEDGLNSKIGRVDHKIDRVVKNLTIRRDRLGKQLPLYNLVLTDGRLYFLQNC